MKYLLQLVLLFQIYVLSAQNITFGEQTSLYLGDETVFFFGGNTSLDGTVSNNGTIVSYTDIDFVLNTDVGNIKFTGRADQNVSGDTLRVGNFVVDKQGKLSLLTDRIIVSGALETTNGVIDAQDEDDLLVSGSTMEAGAGYVEGKLVGISQGGPITFPMGVNGSPNYMTVSSLASGSLVSVECRIPNQESLLPDEDIVGISDEVEWILRVTGDSTTAQVSVNFSGVDLQNFSNGDPIQAREYEPAIVLFSKEDTLYHSLNGTVRDANADFSSAVITSSDNILITNEGRRLGIAWIPIIVEPELWAPKAFAPNAILEENRVFKAYFSLPVVSSISVRIFDSFNQEVYSLTESGDELDISQFGWNGTLASGQEAPEGVYLYAMSVVAESVEYTRTGSVLLVK
ncbi:flagellar hook assembly protein FlgD [Ekhidna sp.]